MKLDMEGLEHKYVDIELGIRMHCVMMGTGPPVLLIHGFPDFWYSFRYQIPALAAAGYRVYVPDLRGYGESDIPKECEKYTFLDIMGDIVGLLEALNITEKVFLVGHDQGVGHVWNLVRFRPELVRAVVSLGVMPYPWINQMTNYLDLRRTFNEDVYINIFQEPGRAEALFAKEKTHYLLKSFLTRWHEDPRMGIPKVYSDDEETLRPLPDWLTPADLQFYADTFKRTGFTGGLNQYRNLKRGTELCAAWRDKLLEAPAILIQASHDIPLITSADSKFSKEDFLAKKREFCPNLQDIVTIDSGHFLHQEQHEMVNKLIVEFLASLQPS
ncbi:hypothetical protein Mapa_001016 [Marchantia paleacea]|nr:hypothetical protein Mapa_001016 [Marchantia paleacea]